ncbi:hypothetical protein ART_3519 [Arthrobacter sp. PAMC 25486]|uniref:hypothetical protein n=1 Tax=Arthrobacter sp. PAMC 25486 TaxID=1494608 RepID=UPI000535A251|nr:hypothetical protein [Arthrobacter sp. PAMC 25486]AIY03118.1 hypothetical protein ART_3519 [Arthrobacter sp. PAMC 25486]
MSQIQNNLSASRFEFYEAGALSMTLRYCMHNGQIWLLDTSMSSTYDQQAQLNYFYLWVLQDIQRRRIEVLPFCPKARQYMLANPHFLDFIPNNPPGHFTELKTTAGLRKPAAKASSTRTDNAAIVPATSIAKAPPTAAVYSLRAHSLKHKKKQDLQTLKEAAATPTLLEAVV